MKKIISIISVFVILLTGCSGKVYQAGTYNIEDFDPGTYTMTIKSMDEGLSGVTLEIATAGTDSTYRVGQYQVDDTLTVPIDPALLSKFVVTGGTFTLEKNKDVNTDTANQNSTTDTTDTNQ